MNLKKALSKQTIAIGMPGVSKNEIIRNLVDLAAESGKVRDVEQALESVMLREAKMSTGMQHGIAIPHGKTDAVEELVAAFAVSQEPVDFDSIDGKPAQIFVCTLSPKNRSGPHIQFLAEIGKLLAESDRRERVLSAKTPEDVLKVLKQ